MQKGIETKCENCGRKLKVKEVLWLTDEEFNNRSNKDEWIKTTEQNPLEIQCRHCHKINKLVPESRPVITVKPYKGYCDHLYDKGYPSFNG